MTVSWFVVPNNLKKVHLHNERKNLSNQASTAIIVCKMKARNSIIEILKQKISTFHL